MFAAAVSAVLLFFLAASRQQCDADQGGQADAGPGIRVSVVAGKRTERSRFFVDLFILFRFYLITGQRADPQDRDPGLVLPVASADEGDQQASQVCGYW